MEMLKTGLVSITFRNLLPEALIDLVTQAGQQGVEWGGDVHVPHGDIPVAERVGELTRDAGLEVAAYGSYYRAGEMEDSPEIEAVLDSAEALGAPTIRVWAGKRGSEEADEAYRGRVEEDLRRISGLARPRNLRVCLEYHGDTLTDDADSARALLDALPLDNLDTLWQPPNGQSVEVCQKSLEAVLPRVSNVHVFHWGEGGGDRYPLSLGEDRWLSYLRTLASTGVPRYALMEFVKEDDPAQYLADAQTLRRWISGLESES